MKLLNILRGIKKNFLHYATLIEVLVLKDNLLGNLHEYQKHYPILDFSPVLKSNAYGHGLIEVARILDKEKIPFFTVDSLYEAELLRDNGIRSKILVIGYIDDNNLIHSQLIDVIFTITSLEQLQKINENISQKKMFHLKIDTGMHRQGVLLDQIKEVLEIIKANKFIELDGICSHFSDADGLEEDFTLAQIENWEQAVSLSKNAFPDIKYYHLANTAGSIYTSRAFCNVVRLGIGLYGINTALASDLDLKPALRMESVISSVKMISVGETVGYNNTYKADKATRIATVPVGYFEGVDRRLSNCGHFKVNGVDCPIIGRVSMNITSIDISGVANVKLGDKVTIISDKKEDNNSIENIAKCADTIPYEILVHIPPHLRRNVI